MELLKRKYLHFIKEDGEALEIEITELSIGLLWEIEAGNKQDDLKTILIECSSITPGEADIIGVNCAKEVYNEIISLTYGDTPESKSEVKKN